jgi:hypothetical protein
MVMASTRPRSFVLSPTPSTTTAASKHSAEYTAAAPFITSVQPVPPTASRKKESPQSPKAKNGSVIVKDNKPARHGHWASLSVTFPRSSPRRSLYLSPRPPSSNASAHTKRKVVKEAWSVSPRAGKVRASHIEVTAKTDRPLCVLLAGGTTAPCGKSSPAAIEKTARNRGWGDERGAQQKACSRCWPQAQNRHRKKDRKRLE